MFGMLPVEFEVSNSPQASLACGFAPDLWYDFSAWLDLGGSAQGTSQGTRDWIGWDDVGCEYDNEIGVILYHHMLTYPRFFSELYLYVCISNRLVL